MKNESVTKDSITLESIKADLENLKANTSVGKSLHEVELKLSQSQEAMKEAEKRKQEAFVFADSSAYFSEEETIRRLQTEIDLYRARISKLSTMHQISEDEYRKYSNDLNAVINAQKAEQAAKMVDLIDQLYALAEANEALSTAEEEIRTLLDVDLMHKDRNILLSIDSRYFGLGLKKRIERLKDYALDWLDDPRD